MEVHRHMANLTQQLLQDSKGEVFGHLPYSPDLECSSFHLFLGMATIYRYVLEILIYCGRYIRIFILI